MKLRLTATFALGAIVGLGAGCGGGDDAESGPASVVPSSAPLYFDVTLRPEGEAADQAEAALGKVLDSADPSQELITLIEQEAAAEGDPLDYEAEVEPWLGEKFAVFLTTIGGDSADSEGAFVFETTDVEEAYEYFKTSERASGESGEYEGTEYIVDDEGDWLGPVDDFIVGGDPNAFKAAVDAGNDNLGESDEFNDSVGDLPEDSLATFYLPPEQFLDAIDEQELDAEARPFAEKALGDALDEPILGDLTASADALTLEFSAGGEGAEPGESDLLETLPADTWLGLGLADVGAAVGRGLESLDEADIPNLDADQIREQLQTQSGIDLNQDVIEPLGDAAVFVQGTTQANLSGALVIETSDPTASGQLLSKLQTLIRQQGKAAGVNVAPLASATGDQGFQLTDPELKQPIQVVQRGERIVAGYGQGSVDQVLEGGTGAQTLASNPAFTGAKEAIGDLGIDAFLSFAPVFQLAEAMGAADDPSYQRAKPYLDKLESVAVGSGAEDDRSLVRLIVGLTP